MTERLEHGRFDGGYVLDYHAERGGRFFAQIYDDGGVGVSITGVKPGDTVPLSDAAVDLLRFLMNRVLPSAGMMEISQALHWFEYYTNLCAQDLERSRWTGKRADKQLQRERDAHRRRLLEAIGRALVTAREKGVSNGTD